MISACIITYNEEEMIGYCLRYLNSLKNLREICILDSFSTDKTMQIISEFKTEKMLTIGQQEFENFGQQKNDCISLASEDWILLIDADETYSYQLDRLLGDINEKKLDEYLAIRIDTYITYPDRKHYINKFDLDPHIRIWRRKACSYVGECHERLYDLKFRDLHTSKDKDILNLRDAKEYQSIVMLHHQRLKSKNALVDKGRRWDDLDMLRKSARQRLPVDKMSWVKMKEFAIANSSHLSNPIPPESWDFKE